MRENGMVPTVTEVSCQPSLHPACRAAREGCLWGPALLLARHVNEKAFLETAAAMAQHHFPAGAPLRALVLQLTGRAEALVGPDDGQPGAELAADCIPLELCCWCRLTAVRCHFDSCC